MSLQIWHSMTRINSKWIAGPKTRKRVEFFLPEICLEQQKARVGRVCKSGQSWVGQDFPSFGCQRAGILCFWSFSAQIAILLDSNVHMIVTYNCLTGGGSFWVLMICNMRIISTNCTVLTVEPLFFFSVIGVHLTWNVICTCLNVQQQCLDLNKNTEQWVQF